MTVDPGHHGRSRLTAKACRRAVLMLLLAIPLAGTTASVGTAARTGSFPGLPDPGTPTGLSIQAASTPAKLRGPDARLQLVVTANYSTGQQRDCTHAVRYAAEPANVVSVSSAGE